MIQPALKGYEAFYEQPFPKQAKVQGEGLSTLEDRQQSVQVLFPIKNQNSKETLREFRF
jgi:hypothetical protein